MVQQLFIEHQMEPAHQSGIKRLYLFGQRFDLIDLHQGPNLKSSPQALSPAPSLTYVMSEWRHLKVIEGGRVQGLHTGIKGLEPPLLTFHVALTTADIVALTTHKMRLTLASLGLLILHLFLSERRRRRRTGIDPVTLQMLAFQAGQQVIGK